jgi:hypothetical protein
MASSTADNTVVAKAGAELTSPPQVTGRATTNFIACDTEVGAVFVEANVAGSLPKERQGPVRQIGRETIRSVL